MNIKKLIDYITRSWDNEPTAPPHPRIKHLPPFLWEILSYIVGLSIAY